MPVFGTLTEPRVRSLQHLDVQRSDVNLDQRKSCCESLTHHPAGFDGERGCMTCWPANCSTAIVELGQAIQNVMVSYCVRVTEHGAKNVSVLKQNVQAARRDGDHRGRNLPDHQAAAFACDEPEADL